MKVGFTGTQSGMTPQQRRRFVAMLSVMNVDEFHHGDCVGADAHAHAVAEFFDAKIVIHPPDDPKKRAFCEGDVLLPERPYLERNKDIVDETELLIATPGTSFEPTNRRAGGTWMTIRYARKVGKPFRIIWPDGEVYGES